MTVLSAAPAKTETGGRILYPDMLKFFAIVGVLIIHISAVGFGGYRVLSANWYICVLWGSAVRWSVPVFFMCSGIFFLDGERSFPLRRMYTKYILRLAAALIFWACLYELRDLIAGYLHNGVWEFSLIKRAVRNLATGSTHFHLYFLYIMILIYALVPLMRVFVLSADKRTTQYFLVVWFALADVLPMLRHFYPFRLLKGIPAQYAVNLTYAMLGYFVLGSYLHRYPPQKRTRRILYALGAAGFVLTVGATAAVSGVRHAAQVLFLEGTAPNVAFMAAAVFLLTQELAEKVRSQRFKGIISLASKSSFCIYLTHDFFNILLRGQHVDVFMLSPAVSVPMLGAAVFAMSLCVYFVLRRIPGVNRYLI